MEKRTVTWQAGPCFLVAVKDPQQDTDWDTEEAQDSRRCEDLIKEHRRQQTGIQEKTNCENKTDAGSADGPRTSAHAVS